MLVALVSRSPPGASLRLPRPPENQFGHPVPESRGIRRTMNTQPSVKTLIDQPTYAFYCSRRTPICSYDRTMLGICNEVDYFKGQRRLSRKKILGIHIIWSLPRGTHVDR